MNKKSIIIFLLLVLLIPVAKVNAITINDYKKELSDLQKEKEYVQKNQAEIQKKIDEANAEILKISEKTVIAYIYASQGWIWLAIARIGKSASFTVSRFA